MRAGRADRRANLRLLVHREIVEETTSPGRSAGAKTWSTNT